MQLLTKKQFSELCGLKTNVLATYAKRHKVLYTGDKVNAQIEPNRSFLIKWQQKNGIRPIKIEEPELISYPADAYFYERMQVLTDSMPTDKTERIKNEVAFLVVELFERFNRWTDGTLNQEWLTEKCDQWTESSIQDMDRINKG